VTLVGPRSSLSRLVGAAARRPAARPAWWRALDPRPWLGFAREAWANASVPLRSALLALVGLTAVSVLVFRFAMDLTLLDAFYFIVATVTTTGYGDITPMNAPGAVKLYACLVMVLGSAMTAVLYSIITDFLVTARFAQVLGREPVPREGHVVVIGLGDVGFRVVEELRQAGIELAVVDRGDEGRFVEAVRGQVPVVLGDARLPAVLGRAGLERASALVCVTGDDVVNLGVALAARDLRRDVRTVVRLFDADFARKAREAFRLDAALSTSLLAAPQFAASALYPDVRAAFVEGDRLVVLRELRVDEGEGLVPSRLPAERGLSLLLRRRPGEADYRASIDDAPLEAREHVLVLVSRPLVP
jgi:Trk K+ transport system NAD-binding subunit